MAVGGKSDSVRLDELECCGRDRGRSPAHQLDGLHNGNCVELVVPINMT